MPIDRACDLGVAGLLAAVRLGADHLDDLAAPCDKFAERLGLLRRDRSRLGMDRFGEMRDGLGIQPIGLGPSCRWRGQSRGSGVG